MNLIVDELRVLIEPTEDIPPSANRAFKLGEDVLVNNEEKKDWLGPLIAVGSTKMMISVYNSETKLWQTFNTFKAIP